MSIQLPCATSAQLDYSRAARERRARLWGVPPSRVMTPTESFPGGDKEQKQKASGEESLWETDVPYSHEYLLIASEGFEQEAPQPVSIKAIIRAVAAKHGIRVPELMSHRRHAVVVAARHDAIVQVYLARPNMSLPQIGRLFHRDHTSILSCLRKAGVYHARRPNKGDA